MLQLCLDWA
jgi:hypothetical protein